ncbi:hypothetical protein GH146_04415 [archaeon]|nr:hypothetical protein [archaeon]TET24948.1 MAG: hypothetical protein E3J73_07275 [Candidatus Bathyarchaeum sp.]
MSDPVNYFETKLKGLCLAELQAYKKRLDESITQKISETAPNEQIAPLILYRGILEHEIKSRTNQK